MTTTPRPLCCIVGPTAAGKSALALQLAQARGLSIISADSRQLYRHFDVGTAKPTREEQALAPHYGIDCVDPVERYSAHRWAESAGHWCREAAEQGAPPLIVGGTGLYVRALVQPLAAVPSLDDERRRLLAPWLDALDRAQLQRWCDRLDPPRAHLGRTQQLRAVETALLSGTRISDALRGREEESAATTVPVRYLVVDPGPVLAARIEARVHAMVAAGFVEEIERLRSHVPPDAPAWNASGYGVMRDAVEGRLSLRAAIDRVIIETRQYAKRQRTWFRHQLPMQQVLRIDPLAPMALAETLAWWDAAHLRDGGHE